MKMDDMEYQSVPRIRLTCLSFILQNYPEKENHVESNKIAFKSNKITVPHMWRDMDPSYLGDLLLN